MKFSKFISITAFGETKTLGEWFSDSRCFVKTLSAFRYRIIASGMTLTEAVESPRRIKEKAEVPIGTRRGKLVSTAEHRRTRETMHVLCVCDCGKKVWRPVHDFLHVTYSTCGCSRIRPASAEKKRKSKSEWQKIHRERRREYIRQWKLDNPDRVAAYDHYRRQASTQGPEREAVKQLYRDARSSVACVCYLCGKITLTPGERQVDHRIPICRDGDQSRDNLAIACNDCNLRKHAKTDLEFLRENHERADEITIMFFWLLSHLSL